MEYSKVVRIPHIKNKLIKPEIDFLRNLNSFVGPIYVYGSILRRDYFPNKSDIDVAIFADDIDSTVAKLAVFLGINKSKIKVFKLESISIKSHRKSTFIGFKTNYCLQLNYKPKWYEFKKYKRFEISIYNMKNKQGVLAANISHLKMSFFCSLKLMIIKIFYYYFYLNIQYYKYLKSELMNKCNNYTNNISIIATL